LNIIIDARAVTNNRTGIGNYTVNLAEGLVKVDVQNCYKVLSTHFRHKIKNWPLLSGFFRVIIYCYDNSIFPFQLALKKTALYHNPAFILPLLNFGYKKIITIHDLGFYVFGSKFARNWHSWHLRFMLPYSIRHADKIIAVSQATKQQIIDIFKVASEKIVVTYEGVSEKFRLIQDKIGVEKVLAKYGIKRPYILFVGTMDPRKNLVRLIKAFQEAKKTLSDLKLVIVGSKGELYTPELNKLISAGDIVLTGYVGEEDLAYLYNGADVFAFPSLYEGFGLPILEAMACGTPVITSQVYSMPEVAGDAALLVDPENIEEIAAAIRRLINDHELRKGLIEKGLARAKQFTWAKTAAETLAIYQEVINQQ
jgi:glycosyltransferase involved in cell wall biosynthesis